MSSFKRSIKRKNLLTQKEKEVYLYLCSQTLELQKEGVLELSQIVSFTVHLEGINQALNKFYKWEQMHELLLRLESKAKIFDFTADDFEPSWDIQLFTFDLKNQLSKQKSQLK